MVGISREGFGGSLEIEAVSVLRIMGFRDNFSVPRSMNYFPMFSPVTRSPAACIYGTQFRQVFFGLTWFTTFLQVNFLLMYGGRVYSGRGHLGLSDSALCQKIDPISCNHFPFATNAVPRFVFDTTVWFLLLGVPVVKGATTEG